MANKTMRIFQCSDIRNKSFLHFSEDMKTKKDFCDVTFQVGSESISAHRIIITAVIPCLRNILSNNCEKKLDSVSLPDIEPNAFRSLIEFAYTCEVKINEDNVKNLLAASCYLGVDEVRDECCDFLDDNLDPGNVLNVREFAKTLQCSKLLNIADRYVAEHFCEISETKEFLDYSSTDMLDLVSQDDLNVENEEKVFESLLRWIKASPEIRKEELPKFLVKVRMPLLSIPYLATVVEKEELIRTSFLCRDLVDEARNYVLLPELRKDICSFSTEPRNSRKVMHDEESDGNSICKLYVEETFTAQFFNMKNRNWTTQKKVSFYTNAGSTAVLHNKIYFFNWGYTREYNAVNNEYKSLRSMPTPRIFTGSCSLKDKIYVCGGRIDYKSSNAVEYFAPKENRWISVRNMNIGREVPSAVRFGEYIFVLGGYDEGSNLDSVERYDSVTDKWTVMPSMLTKRGYGAAAVLKGKLYVCGGTTSGGGIIESAEMYDPAKKCWDLISPMNSARSEFTLLSCSGKLRALGGVVAKNDLPTFDIYDPETDEWTTGPSTDPGYRTSGAVVIFIDQT